MMSGRNGATTVNQAAIGRVSFGVLNDCVSMPVGLAAAREAVLPPADIVHTALLPLAGEGARPADDVARAASCPCSSPVRQQESRSKAFPPCRRQTPSFACAQTPGAQQHTPPSRPSLPHRLLVPAGYSTL